MTLHRGRFDCKTTQGSSAEPSRTIPSIFPPILSYDASFARKPFFFAARLETAAIATASRHALRQGAFRARGRRLSAPPLRAGREHGARVALAQLRLSAPPPRVRGRPRRGDRASPGGRACAARRKRGTPRRAGAPRGTANRRCCSHAKATTPSRRAHAAHRPRKGMLRLHAVDASPTSERGFVDLGQDAHRVVSVLTARSATRRRRRVASGSPPERPSSRSRGDALRSAQTGTSRHGERRSTRSERRPRRRGRRGAPRTRREREDPRPPRTSTASPAR